MLIQYGYSMQHDEVDSGHAAVPRLREDTSGQGKCKNRGQFIGTDSLRMYTKTENHFTQDYY